MLNPVPRRDSPKRNSVKRFVFVITQYFLPKRDSPAFAIATCSEPDILVIDEALSVGDGEFARKSFDRIMKLKQRGTTILFCSHSLFHIEALCSRALWIDGGKIVRDGHPHQIIPAYQDFLDGAKIQPAPPAAHKTADTAPDAGGSEAAIAEGLRSVRWPARMQRLTAGPYGEAARAADAELWLDGGHNPHAGTALAQGADSYPSKPVMLVIGSNPGGSTDGEMRLAVAGDPGEWTAGVYRAAALLELVNAGTTWSAVAVDVTACDAVAAWPKAGMACVAAACAVAWAVAPFVNSPTVCVALADTRAAAVATWLKSGTAWVADTTEVATWNAVAAWPKSGTVCVAPATTRTTAVSVPVNASTVCVAAAPARAAAVAVCVKSAMDCDAVTAVAAE